MTQLPALSKKSGLSVVTQPLDFQQNASYELRNNMIKCLTVGQGRGTITIETLPNTGRYDRRKDGSNYQKCWLDATPAKAIQNHISICGSTRRWKAPRGVSETSQRDTGDVRRSSQGILDSKNYAQVGVVTTFTVPVAHQPLRVSQAIGDWLSSRYLHAYYTTQRNISQQVGNRPWVASEVKS